MKYSSPSKVVSPRDCLYLKLYKQLPDRAPGAFILAYKSIDYEKQEEEHNFERTDILIGAHLIEPLEGDENKCRLTYIQQATPGGWVPNW
eukprot:CAMPEP_0174251368 /NCGR_PEP_ID=MMETSP0439-20130205/1211_1 /TAXON_ID=0 /ORGANISM="Stereomyxa ramosa, Strain Chinc5" /LENGTH=89 /DNA_ID=CAMNT_0015331661 /DNA_START=316 /DNA_END=582 /DNA_ORIENTATION=+